MIIDAESMWRALWVHLGGPDTENSGFFFGTSDGRMCPYPRTIDLSHVWTARHGKTELAGRVRGEVLRRAALRAALRNGCDFDLHRPTEARYEPVVTVATSAIALSAAAYAKP